MLILLDNICEKAEYIPCLSVHKVPARIDSVGKGQYSLICFLFILLIVMNLDVIFLHQILVILNKNLDSLVSTLEQSLQRVDKVKVHVQVTGGCQNVLNK